MDNENMENGVFNHGRIKDVDVKEEMKSSFLDERYYLPCVT